MVSRTMITPSTHHPDTIQPTTVENDLETLDQLLQAFAVRTPGGRDRGDQKDRSAVQMNLQAVPSTSCEGESLNLNEMVSKVPIWHMPAAEGGKQKFSAKYDWPSMESTASTSPKTEPSLRDVGVISKTTTTYFHQDTKQAIGQTQSEMNADLFEPFCDPHVDVGTTLPPQPDVLEGSHSDAAITELLNEVGDDFLREQDIADQLDDSILPAKQGTSPSSTTSTVSSSASPTVHSKATPKKALKRPKRIRRLCNIPGCIKRARSKGHCISHGGGKRCSVDGCEKSSQGNDRCIKHGGGKRCNIEGCDKAAQTNSLCKAHGGGRRCKKHGCCKSSQGGGYCRLHGGGKRCAHSGCDKGTQRGPYCALHGGSRFCSVEGCSRNDRGGGLCAYHGGGKRCSVHNCGGPCRRNDMCSYHLRVMGLQDYGRSETSSSNGSTED